MSEHNHDDWTTGPAKWAALIVLGSASLFGLAWSIANHAPSPRRGEVPSLRGGEGSSDAPSHTAARSDSGGETEPADTAAPSLAPVKINLNTASTTELDLLPRIGPTLAARIVEDREANGPFGSLDDLQRVAGIGPRTVERITPYAEAGAPSDPP